MSSLAIITARGGSKRIPRKNIKPFMGKPMICYAIEAALGSKIFDEVMVSTDDCEIAGIARRSGAQVPFMRSEATANDFAPTQDVIREVITQYDMAGKRFDICCCIYPCVPFLTADMLKSAGERFLRSGADSLIPAVKFSFPIQRAFRQSTDGCISFREPECALTRTQDLEPMYHDAGMFYFLKLDSFQNYHAMVMPRTILFEMDESMVQDIDNDKDWEISEIKYKLLQERKIR